MLVQVCGLPGTGKSTLAAGLAEQGPSVLLRIDAIDAAMRRNGFTPAQTGIACYSVAHAVALPHLRRGMTVIADAVSPVAAAREGWRGTAEAAGVPLWVIETVLPDPEEHRRRVEDRTSDLAGFTVPSWSEVQAVAAAYEPRHADRLVLATRRDRQLCVTEALQFLEWARAQLLVRLKATPIHRPYRDVPESMLCDATTLSGGSPEHRRAARGRLARLAAALGRAAGGLRSRSRSPLHGNVRRVG